MIRKPFVFIVVVSLFYSLCMAGGPWAEGSKKGFFEASAGFSLGNSSYIDNNYQIYTEVGIGNRINVKLILPFRTVGITDQLDTLDAKRLTGISNIVLGANYQLLKSKPLSIGLDVELKTINKNDIFGLRTGSPRYSFLPNVSFGHAFDKGYLITKYSFGVLTDDFSLTQAFQFEIGYTGKKNLLVALYANYFYSFNNGDFAEVDLPVYNRTGFGIDNQRYLTIGPKLLYEIDNGLGISTSLLFTLGQAGSGDVIAPKIGIYYDW